MYRPRSAIVLAIAVGVTLVWTSGAQADMVPQQNDIVGEGNYLSQSALNFIADGYIDSNGVTKSGYNRTADNRLISYDAITLNRVWGDKITLEPGVVWPRPGSGDECSSADNPGPNNLLFSNVNPLFDFARSSTALSMPEIAANLQAVPFAIDGLQLAVAKSGTNAPATISATDMVKIYNGTYTNWSQLGGANAPIIPYIPVTEGSPCAAFRSQLKRANFSVEVALADSVRRYDNSTSVGRIFDPSDPFYGPDSVNAVAPVSTGRASLAPDSSLVSLEGGFSAKRTLYNVVRGSAGNKPWFHELFGTGGYLCSSGAKGAISAAGFAQLATPDSGGTCGVPTQAQNTNWTTS